MFMLNRGDSVSHVAKTLIPCVLYLSWPSSAYSTLILLPAAILLGVTIMVMTLMFKEYL
ncbi:DUF4400 domain-containing protein [Xenorhabdus bovienii]|nr:DUF4400 domain-containing protein [Xenorhabdus bovienii]MDE9492046.1 DUF4400 domain-containing protein [Xenorhabdus bovienii]MDE9500439.1 DUF4400 domain-containing protein [Xenorhabdus bovienii]MDE9524230.1 DUF4400 domain-containing protein [Xenorhabdus bovienii]MDE9541694.1 DUF4400 domain-containing protein [Xenorhabdus bovienii]